jgi:acetyl esterase/lipase
MLGSWRSRNVRGPAPLTVFVHGGGWSRGSKDNATGRWKAMRYLQQGCAFTAISCRPVPQATVEQEAQDVAMALKSLFDRAAMLGIDKRRVVLMGHSAGAHQVALAGTDERYLRAAALSFADLAGVVPIDGACYDIPAKMAGAGDFMKPACQIDFDTNLERVRALSPAFNAAALNAPRLRLLHVERPDSMRQAQELAMALRPAGTDVDEQQFAPAIQTMRQRPRPTPR